MRLLALVAWAVASLRERRITALLFDIAAKRLALGSVPQADGRMSGRERERGRQDGRQVRDGGTYLDHPVWVSCLETYIGIV